MMRSAEKFFGRIFDARGSILHCPFGRYLSQALTIKCETISDVRQFLSTCRAVSDKEQFGKDEYWQPPEDFEKSKKGDCEDFALWTWRELLSMGYDARFVAGRHGRYGIGHAWVTFQKDGRHYLLEPQLRFIGETFPRLSTLRYEPKFSVTWDGAKVSFYEHALSKGTPSIRQLLPLLVSGYSAGGNSRCGFSPRFLFGSGDEQFARL